jgi:hypothetical protein
VLTVADLLALAEGYGEGTLFVDFRAKLRGRHRGSGVVSALVDSTQNTGGALETGDAIALGTRVERSGR